MLKDVKRRVKDECGRVRGGGGPGKTEGEKRTLTGEVRISSEQTGRRYFGGKKKKKKLKEHEGGREARPMTT